MKRLIFGTKIRVYRIISTICVQQKMIGQLNALEFTLKAKRRAKSPNYDIIVQQCEINDDVTEEKHKQSILVRYESDNYLSCLGQTKVCVCVCV